MVKVECTSKTRILMADGVPSDKVMYTFRCVYPRFIHAQVLTHRNMARNTMSSRAVPTKRVIEEVERNPVWPRQFGANQKGMVAGEPLTGDALKRAEDSWDSARLCAIELAQEMADNGVHKEVVNRILEPFLHIVTYITVEQEDLWAFLMLRTAPDAQPEIQELAHAMHDAATAAPFRESTTHLPLGGPTGVESDSEIVVGQVVSIARVSYSTDLLPPLVWSKQLEFYATLIRDKHWSPFEHVVAHGSAFPAEKSGVFGKHGLVTLRDQLGG